MHPFAFSSTHSLLLIDAFVLSKREPTFVWVVFASNLQLCVSLTLCHIYSRGGSGGKTCADHAAALGPLDSVRPRGLKLPIS